MSGSIDLFANILFYISTTSLRGQVVKLTKNNTEAAQVYPTLTNWLLVSYYFN